MPKQTKAVSKSKPTAGMKLHKYIALGGDPKNFNKVNKKK